MAGLSRPIQIMIVSWGTTAIVLSAVAARRFQGAHDAAGEDLDSYPVKLPGERVAVGRLLQMRLLPPTRNVWAPGLLCVRPGEIRFVPSKPKLADRAWRGRARRVEVHSLPTSASVVRVHGDDGSGQFVVQVAQAEVEASLRPFVPVAPRDGMSGQ